MIEIELSEDKIFGNDDFQSYREAGINSYKKIVENFENFSTQYISPDKTTIFLSHKHEDLNKLKDIIGFLEEVYNVNVYIDCYDSLIPKKTSGKTATRIRSIIDKCDKFILFATEDAIESKWCNWELGYGDAKKSIDKIALFPIGAKDNDNQYKGHEYLQIYPYIIHLDGTISDISNKKVQAGYYVVSYQKDKNFKITPLEDWLKK